MQMMAQEQNLCKDRKPEGQVNEDMKKKSIALGTFLVLVVVVLLSVYVLTHPTLLGNMNHSYREPATSSSEVSFLGETGDRIKFSFASDVRDGDLDMFLYDSKGNIVYELDKAKRLEAFLTLNYTDTYTLKAEYKDFVGDFQIKVYKVRKK